MTARNRLSLDDLQVGRRYLHVNGSIVRTIDSIQGDSIRWHDQYGPGTMPIYFQGHLDQNTNLAIES